MNRRELSIWLRGIVAIFFLLGTALFFVILPLAGRQQMIESPRLVEVFWPALVFLWLTAVPIYMILISAWRIFAEIGRDNSYCNENATRLKFISYLSMIESVLYMLALILLFVLGYTTTTVVLLCMFVVVIGVAFSVATASLSHIVEKNCREQLGREEGEQSPPGATSGLEIAE